MSTLKILSDTSCVVRCDFQEVGNIQIGELFKLQLKKGCYILEFLVEDIVIVSMDYTIETNDEEPLLRLNIKEQAEKKIREREFAYVYSEDGLSIIGCDETLEGDLIVPEGVKYIAERAFANCKLTSVYIPDSVTRIGIGAFRCCRSLTSVTIGNSVESIDDFAFENCSRLTSVTIGNSVIGIGLGAFRSCRCLTSITIPNSVTNIGNFAFEDCDGLTSVHISDIAAWCKIAFISAFSNPLFLAQHLFLNGEEIKDVVIPNSVKIIRFLAFYGWSGLTSIKIPISVKSIEPNAFVGCWDLTTIIVEQGNTKYDSRNNCNAIIETSSNRLIVGCKNTTIPNSVTSIGVGAFQHCSSLTSIMIPNSVTSIGDDAFFNCYGLTSVTIPNSVMSIGHDTFAYCECLTSVTIGNSVTSIGFGAFRSCSRLTTIAIPNSVMSIGDSVFRDCDNLKEIIIPKGTKAKFEELLPDQKDKLVEQEEMTNNETMDRILYFDTETTGVPLNYKAPSSDTNNWPRLVQLAWILTDEEGTRIHTGNLVIKPDGFVIPADATKVHGITTQRAKEEGVPLAEVIERFKSDLDMATYIVGHNIEFDKKIVGAEMIRLGMKDDLEKKKSYCTMQSSIDFCKIPGKYGYKYPKLQELYRKLFDADFEDAHNAMSDIEATEKCFWELRKRKLI